MIINQLRTRSFFLWCLALATLALTLGSSTSAVAQTSTLPKTLSAGDGYTYVPFAGQSIAIDRKTGKLRPPTPTEARKLAEGLKKFLSRSDQGLTIVTHRSGAQSVDLQGRFQSVTLAKINHDGSTSEKCVTSMREARAFLATAKAKANLSAPPANQKKADHPAEEE